MDKTLRALNPIGERPYVC